MKKKVLLTSVVTIILCLCLIAGSTYALFTSNSSVSIVVQSATVQVNASVASLKTWSLEDKVRDDTTDRKGAFSNGGKAYIDANGKLQIEKMSPGDVVQVTIHVANGSNIDTKCRAMITSSNNTGLLNLLDPNSLQFNWTSTLPVGGSYAKLAPNENGTIVLTFELPKNAGNEYQNKSVDIQVLVEAIQANGV